jgi:hypothetical protein
MGWWGGTILATERQILANQQNAAKSSGPKTAQGKVVSSKNAVKFGLRTLALLPDEDKIAYESFAEEYYSYLQPEGPVETSLVDEMIRCDWWRQQRFVQVETQLLADAMKKELTVQEEVARIGLTEDKQISSAFAAFRSQGALERLQRYAATYDNKYYRALHELMRLQAVRRGQKVAAPVALDVTISGSNSSEGGIWPNEANFGNSVWQAWADRWGRLQLEALREGGRAKYAHNILDSRAPAGWHADGRPWRGILERSRPARLIGSSQMEALADVRLVGWTAGWKKIERRAITGREVI